MPADLRFEQMCDASAAVLVEDRLLVANDEDNVLRVYDVHAGGPPIQPDIDLRSALDPQGRDREADLEAAATLDGITWWIGSHARNRKGKTRPNRRVLLATRVGSRNGQVTVEVVGAHHSSRKHGLLHAMFDIETLGPQLRRAEKRPPKADGGFNIEGMVAHDGSLLIGLRNPIIDGCAVVLRLDRPHDLLSGSGDTALRGGTIDLGGLGIRSLSPSPRGDGLLVVAGVHTGDRRFALYEWSGPPRRCSSARERLGLARRPTHRGPGAARRHQRARAQRRRKCLAGQDPVQGPRAEQAVLSRPNVEFEAEDGVLAHDALPMGMPYKSFSGRLRLSTDESLAEIEEFLLDSPMMSAELSGTIGHAPETKDAPVDVNLKLSDVDPTLLEFFKAAGAKMAPNGSAALHLGGTWGKPTFQ